jgi:hypothetical protein
MDPEQKKVVFDTDQWVGEMQQASHRSEEGSVMQRWVIKLSGGKIENGQQANLVLLAGAVIIILIAIVILIQSLGPAIKNPEKQPGALIPAGPSHPNNR